MMNIQKMINKEAIERAKNLSKERNELVEPKYYTIDEIFFS
jgi:hypothetical protein